MRILIDGTLPNVRPLFHSCFTLTPYHSPVELLDHLSTHDILICRSTLKITDALLKNTHLQCIGTASSGTDHIDEDALKKHHITLFDAKGSNARAVADYVMTTLAYIRRHHPSIGMRAGIIGLGCVGSEVKKRLHAADYKTSSFDPLKAMRDPSFHSCTYDELLSCDVVCVHANLHATQPFPSLHLINQEFLKLSQARVIINAARGGIVKEAALLRTPFDLLYCTDVYAHEPKISPDIIARATLCTPHIAGHTIEAKKLALIHLSHKIHEHYQISFPHEPTHHLLLQTPCVQPLDDWEDRLLNIYNPWYETQQLKASVDPEKTFLTLRRAHTQRHDLREYDTQAFSLHMQRIFGVDVT